MVCIRLGICCTAEARLIGVRHVKIKDEIPSSLSLALLDMGWWSREREQSWKYSASKRVFKKQRLDEHAIDTLSSYTLDMEKSTGLELFWNGPVPHSWKFVEGLDGEMRHSYKSICMLLMLTEQEEGSPHAQLSCTSISGRSLAQVTIKNINEATWKESRMTLGPALKAHLHKGRLEFLLPNGTLATLDHDDKKLQELFQ